MFTDDILAIAESEPAQAIVAACQYVEGYIENDVEGTWTSDNHDILVQAVALIEAIADANSLDFEGNVPNLTGDINLDCKAMRDYATKTLSQFHGIASRSKFDLYKSKFEVALGKTFAYEFSEGDLKRLQTLINELREYLQESDLFEPEHKQRLMKRLEALQAELHKRVSNIDSFWGLVGDAGVVLGKFGDDAKPFVDRIKEIAQIGWRTQARAEELSSDCQNPLLGNSKD